MINFPFEDYQKRINELGAEIAKNQLDLGECNLKLPVGDTHNPLNGVRSFKFEKGYSLTLKDDNVCDHEWINVGFHFDKIVCKKCDCEKK